MFAKLVLKNPRLPRLTAVKVDALADSGAVHLCIPERMRAKLRLEAIDEKVVTLADGSEKCVPYVGPITQGFRGTWTAFATRLRGRLGAGSIAAG